jgi:hypothetical protein
MSDAVNTELELAGPELLVPYDDPNHEAMEAERSLWRAVLWGTIIAIPICIVIWIGIVALAVGGKDPDWGAYIGIGILVGAFAGAFFGGWAAFTAKAHLLDVVDERAAHHS